ncbi:MAG: glycosyltransferase [Flavobacteriales bacterium]|nr:glycosyltransferase [Flavobacteriales bacterium]
MKKISIITISYNQKDFIKEAIDSVLDQECEDLEYIVIDAGSTDGSRDIIDRYSDQIIKVYEPDEGQADGLNKGLRMATGDVIGFVNSDDLLIDGSLRYVAEQFTRRGKLDVLFGSGYKVDEDLNVIHDIYPDRFTVDKYAHMAFNFIQTGTFFKRSAIDRIGGFNLENRTCWDGELIAILGKEGAVMKRSLKKLAAFRIYGSSISGSGSNSANYLADRARLFVELTGRPSDEFLKGIVPFWLRFVNFIETPLKLKVYGQKSFPALWRKTLK